MPQTCFHVIAFPIFAATEFSSEARRLVCCKSCSPSLGLVLESSPCISGFYYQMQMRCTHCAPLPAAPIVAMCFAFLLDLIRGTVCVLLQFKLRPRAY